MSGLEKMRILHVIDSLGRGGAERVVVSLATGQRRDGHDVRVVSLMNPSDLAPELLDANVRVIRLSVGNRRDLPSQVVGLVSEIRRFRPNVVHAHLLFSILASACVPRWLGGTRVATFHNLGSSHAGRRHTRWAAQALLGWAAKRRYHHLTAVSAAVAVAYQRELSLEVAPRTIPNPVDVEAIRRLAPPSRAHARKELALVESRPIIVVVANFKQEKAHDVLLQTVATIAPPQRPMVALVGDGPSREELGALARSLGVADSLRWLGELPILEVLRWMKASDLLVLPSRSEGSPIVILEAMSLGTPIVATTVGGIRWCVGDAGWLVPPDSPELLGRAIQEALADPGERSRRSELATATQLPQFELSRVLETWYRLFSK